MLFRSLGYRQFSDQTSVFDPLVPDYAPYFRFVQLRDQWIHAVSDVLVGGTGIPLHKLRYSVSGGFDHVDRAYVPEQGRCALVKWVQQ